MNLQKLLCFVLMCFGFSLVYAAAQTQPAAGSPAAAPATNPPPAKVAAAPLPDPQTPEEFFARARQLSDLEASGIPFHLKATYVATGDAEFTGNGTYEEWWQSKDLWRKEAKLGDDKYVEIQSGGKQKAAATAAYIPLRVREVMGLEIFHIAKPKENSGGWKLSQGIEGSTATELATQERPCDPRYKSFVCTWQYELSKHFRSGDGCNPTTSTTWEETYTGFQPFGDVYIPMKVAQ